MHDGVGKPCADVGNLGDVSTYFQNNGLRDPGCWPYRTDTPAFAPTPDRNGRSVRGPAFDLVLRPPTQKNWLDTVGPLVSWFDVYNDFDGTPSAARLPPQHRPVQHAARRALPADRRLQRRARRLDRQELLGHRLGHERLRLDRRTARRASTRSPTLRAAQHEPRPVDEAAAAQRQPLRERQRRAAPQPRGRRRRAAAVYCTAGARAVRRSLGHGRAVRQRRRRVPDADRHHVQPQLRARLPDHAAAGCTTGGPARAAASPGTTAASSARRRAGRARFVQGDYGAPGNFEVVVWWPATGSSTCGATARRTGTRARCSAATSPAPAPRLCRATTARRTATSSRRGALPTGQMQHFWRNETTGAWTAVRSSGRGVAVTPVMIQGQYGMTNEAGPHGNFELCVALGGRVQHWWRDNSGGHGLAAERRLRPRRGRGGRVVRGSASA